jgi:PAS domain S-box-containing protein
VPSHQVRQWFRRAVEGLNRATSGRAQVLGDLEAKVAECTRALDAERCERKRTEEALRESELLFRGVFKSRTDAVLVTSPERTVANLNPAAEAMFGYSLDELRGRSTEVFHVDHEHYLRAAEMFRQAFAGGSVASFGFEMKRKNGEVFDTEQTISLLADDHGQPKGIVGVIRDISERQRAEDALRRTQVELAARIAELEQALARVDQLHGILPICSYCKKVRNDSDSWQQVEAYVSAHSAVRFSHGVCPDCVRTVMQPELDEMRRVRALGGKTKTE